MRKSGVARLPCTERRKVMQPIEQHVERTRREFLTTSSAAVCFVALPGMGSAIDKTAMTTTVNKKITIDHVDANFEREPLIRPFGFKGGYGGLHYLLDEATERNEIAHAYDATERLMGRAPEGWYCRYAPSTATRRLLVEHGGFTYDSDAYNDELPYWVQVGDQPHLVIPYSLVTNDAKLVGGPLVTGRAFGEFLIDSFEGLVSEGALHPRMMSVGMHARILGQPGRIKGLRDFIDHVQGRDDVWICRRGDLARHWAEQHPPRESA